MKRQFAKAASAARMLDVFEAKLGELQSRVVESSTEVIASASFTPEQEDILWKIDDKYEGDVADEDVPRIIAQIHKDIMTELGVDAKTAKRAMVDVLMYDPSDIEAITDVEASAHIQLFDDDGYHNYEDTDGMYTGVPGSFVTLAELKNYWNDFYDDDPVLNEEYGRDQGQKWLNDTLRYMKEVESCDSVNASNALHTGRDENTWYIDTNGQFTGNPGEKISRADLIDYWNGNLSDDPSLESDLEGWLDHTIEFMEPVYSNTEEVDEDLEPVKGEQQWGDDQVFMLMSYTGGTEGMESDAFDCYGKFFAVDEADAKRQLSEVIQADPERMQFVDNAYVQSYNDYFDDGSEVYPDLATLVKSSWIAPDDFDGNMPEEPVFESDNIKCSDDMFTEIEQDVAKDAEEQPVKAGMFRDFYFGKEQVEKYGDLIATNLSGQTISKRKDLAEEPGGLIYEANLLGIDMWDLLEALEGMCYQGRAMEIDDSTYKVN